MALSRHAPKPSSPKLSNKDPEAGAYVRIIEMAASAKSGSEAGLLEKGERLGGRLKHPHSFPWRVLLPVTVSPRLRGLILLNLVRCDFPQLLPRCRHAAAWSASLAVALCCCTQFSACITPLMPD